MLLLLSCLCGVTLLLLVVDGIPSNLSQIPLFLVQHPYFWPIYIGLFPFPVIVTTRIISCLVGDSYKPSFATITGKGDNPIYIYIISGEPNQGGLDCFSTDFLF